MTGYYCKVTNCRNSTKNCKKHFFYFPKDVERCKQWVRALGIQELEIMSPIQLAKNFKICEEHFGPWCFMNPENKQRLVHNAVPLTPNKPTTIEETPHSLLVDSLPEDSAESGRTAGAFEDDAGTSDGHFPCLTMDNMEMEGAIVSEVGFATSTPVLQVTPTSKQKRRRKYTPRKLYMAKELKRRTDSLRWYKAQHKPKKITKATVKEQLLKSSVDQKLARFIVRQLDLSEQTVKSRRFTFDEKLFSYSIICKSKSAYRILQTLLHFPSESTLRRFVAGKITRPGINDTVLNSIATVMKGKPLVQATFALVLDEISLKPQLEYNPTRDNVCGFEDLGELGRTQKVANQALVLMIRSLQGKKKLPLCFYLSNGPVSSDNLKSIIDTLIEKLTKAGINIKAIICDQSSSNCCLFKLLGITPDKPYFERHGERIFGIYDPPHLLKTLRRNFMKYDLVTPQGTVSFQHIKDFYMEDQKRPRQLAPCLTDKHVNAEGLNSMSVKLAAQIFSNSVSAGMSALISGNILPVKAEATAHFVGLVNDLFDSCNGSRVHPEKGKRLKCAVNEESPHLKFWKETYQHFKDSYFINCNNTAQSKKKKSSSRPNSTSADCSNEPPPKRSKILVEVNCASESQDIEQPPKALKKFLSKGKVGFELTINSMLALYENLKNCGFAYLMTKRLNQDCLENYFSQIRSLGGNNNNPTPYQFHSSFKIACVNSLTSIRRNKNCQDDEDTFLVELIKAPSEENWHLNEEQLEETMLNLETKIELQDLGEFIFIEDNVIAYLAGYVARRVLEYVNCQNCSNLLTDNEKLLTKSTIFIYLKQYLQLDIEHGLKYPSKEFLRCIKFIVSLCDEIFCDILCDNDVLRIMKEVITQKTNFQDVCNCNDHKDIIKSKTTEIITVYYSV